MSGADGLTLEDEVAQLKEQLKELKSKLETAEKRLLLKDAELKLHRRIWRRRYDH
jgi:hypothetical protein